MHTFQPMTADMMEFDPFTKIGKEWALLTAGSKEKANTMTISWGLSLIHISSPRDVEESRMPSSA